MIPALYGGLAGKLANPTKFLLHMDGANASTVFTDDRGHTMAGVGSAQLSTTSPKFGTASLLLNGSGSYVTTTQTTDVRFGPADFTVEAWIKGTATNRVLLDYYQTGAVNCWQFGYNASGFLEWYSTNGSSAVLILTTTTAVNTGAWVHVAATRASGTLRIFANGALLASVADARDYNAVLGNFTIGAQVNSRNAIYDFNGNIDEVRVLRGRAAWTAAFTPPTAPY